MRTLAALCVVVAALVPLVAIADDGVHLAKRGQKAQTVAYITQCPPGHWSSIFNNVCHACGCGTYAPPSTYAPSTCTTCPAGTYAPNGAATSCISCPGTPAGSCSCLTSSDGAVANKCQYIGQGNRVTVRVQGNTNGNKLFGSDPYAEDSDLGAAVVHAGLASNGQIVSVTLHCVGEQPAFTSSASNGVTSQEYPNAYGAFSFQNLPPPPQAPIRCSQEPCLLNRCVVTGQRIEMMVTGGTGGAVYGSGPFTDDSTLSAAAVHAGVLAVGSEGIVEVTCSGPQASFSGSTRNGVTSLSWSENWQFTYQLLTGPPLPAPVANACNGACFENACPDGNVFDVRVKGTTFGYVWGTDVYSDDSTVASAAVHAGIVTDGETAFIRVSCGGAAQSFSGTTRNGFVSTSYGAWPRTFMVEAYPNDVQPIACPAAHQCLHKICLIPGQMFQISVTGSAVANIWGNQIYSDDSPAAEAAVHMGLVAVGATKTLNAFCKGPQESFASTTANGITSTAYGPWAYSYTLE